MSVKPLGKLKARSFYVDEVYQALLDAISDGSLAPGVRITQEEIATQLNVSRSPVLQAIQLLKKDGLLQDSEGRGVMVAPLNIEHIKYLYEIRGALERLATQLAAEKKAVICKDLLEAGRIATQGSDVKAMIESDEQFHHAIYEASGNPLIAVTAQVHWAHLRRVMGAVLQSPDQRILVWEEHELLAQAIEAGDVPKAVEMCDNHMKNASSKLLERLAELIAET